MKTNKKAFTLIEILVGAVIFMIGFAAVYNLLISTMNLNSYNKNYIIATSLAREQLELFRNIRDTNFSKMQNYDIINPQRCDENNECGCDQYNCYKFQKDKFYRISNDFSNSGGFPVKVEEKMEVDENNLFESLKDYKVCFDLENNFYDYCDYITGNKKELNIYKYIKIDEIGIESGENKDNLHKVVENGETTEKIQYDQNYALKVTSKVYWYNKKFQNFEAETIFTNYKIY